MTTHRNNFAGQTPGTNVTPANSADSGDPFTSVSPNTGTITYEIDPADSSQISIKLTPGSGESCYVRDDSFNSPQISISDRIYYPGPPSGTAPIIVATIGSSSSAGVFITSNGFVRIVGVSGANLGTDTTALITGHSYRFEVQIVSGAAPNGSAAVQWFIDDGDTQTGSLSATGVNTRGGNITRIDRGPADPAASAFFDDWFYTNLQAQDGTITPLGPWPTNTKPTADAGPDQTGIEPYALVTLDGTGSSDPDGDPLTYAWAQTAGTPVTLSGATTAHPTFTAPATIDGDTLTFSLTVNDGSEDSDPDTVDILVATHTWWWIQDATTPVLAPIRASIIP